MSELPRQLWTTVYTSRFKLPKLITVSRTFTTSNSCYTNHDSFLHNGEDEYLDATELFESENAALTAALNITQERISKLKSKIILLESFQEVIKEKLQGDTSPD